VFTVVPREVQQREDTIELLKSYLAAAEAGEITTIGVAALLPDGNLQYGHSATHQPAALLGAVTMLSNLVQRKILQGVESYDEAECEEDE
jgi:hypothetical protein